GDVLLFGIVDFLFSAPCPFTYRCQYFKCRIEALDCNFETDLVVPFTCASMCHIVCICVMGNLHQLFGNEGSAQCRDKRVFLLIHCIAVDCICHELFCKFFGRVYDMTFDRSHIQRFLMDEVKILPFPDVQTYCHNLITFINEPLRSEEHTSELQSRFDLVCRLLLEQKNSKYVYTVTYKSE